REANGGGLPHGRALHVCEALASAPSYEKRIPLAGALQGLPTVRLRSLREPLGKLVAAHVPVAAHALAVAIEASGDPARARAASAQPERGADMERDASGGVRVERGPEHRFVHARDFLRRGRRAAGVGVAAVREAGDAGLRDGDTAQDAVRVL